MAGQWLAAVVRHHVQHGRGQVDRVAASGPVQLEVGPVKVTHDPFGIKKIFELITPVGLTRKPVLLRYQLPSGCR